MNRFMIHRATRFGIVPSLLFAPLLLSPGCGESRVETASHEVRQPTPTVMSATDFGELEKLLRHIAAEYSEFGYARLDVNWSPLSCIGPRDIPMSYSRSHHDETHGRKLYMIYPRNHWEYISIGHNSTSGAVPDVGQTVVKRTWTPIEIPGEDVDAWAPDDRPDIGRVPPVERNGQWFVAGEESDLYIMHKLSDAPDPGTDEGWIYGVTSRDGSVIRAAGVITSCAECHLKAGPGRLFGLRPRVANNTDRIDEE